jgi:nitroimidazol reductase NimA-like FMN-containing flavoprotein (pyridoxamine 5'-phosphate oxidase superfamily)
MRREDKEIIDKEIIETIMQEADYCVIALTDDETPYNVPMNFGYRNNSLYLHSYHEGRKIDILKKNNKVSFVVTDKTEIKPSETPCNWGMKYMSVMGFGKASLIDDTTEKIEALDIIMAKYSGDTKHINKKFDYSEDMIKRIVVINVNVNEMTCKISGF